MSDKTKKEQEKRFDDRFGIRGKDGNNEIVEETKVKEYGEDEAYCMWYRCSNCKDTMITVESNFCPNCGRKIAWGDECDRRN